MVASFVVPTIFMGVLGGNLVQNVPGHLPFDFMQFAFVGMAVNSCFMATIGGMSGLVEKRHLNLTQELFGDSFGFLVSSGHRLVRVGGLSHIQLGV